MHVPITQPTVDIAGDLVFVQPKFHFGQVLEDLQGQEGFVIGMNFDGEWQYILFYTQLETTSRELPESQLASFSTTVSAVRSQPLLKGSQPSI